MDPVLIVGAGPVGLTMAAELARYRVPLRLIDRAPEATQTSKALVLWSRTLELIDRMGCTDSFLREGLRVHRATFRDGGRVLGHAGFDDIASRYAFALMIPQCDTERLMTRHLASLGATVERRVELTGYAQEADHVAARLRHADGREETMRAAWLLGCDGAHSTVRHGTGLAFEGQAQDDDWILADVRIEGEAAPPPDELAIYVHRDGPFVIFPIPGGRARVIATLGRTDPAHPRPEPSLAEVQALVDARTGGGIVARDPVWLSNFRINERKVDAYRSGRVFLAGDAAHIHSPAGGQGMNTGMQDAINLAWKLAMVQHGQASPRLLDSFSPERDAVGAMVLRNATRMTDMATLSNPMAQGLRNLALHVMLGIHAVQDRMASTLSEIEIAYPESPLSAGRHAGTRWAPEHDAGPPPGAGDVPRFVLYAEDAERGAALAARFPALLEQGPRLSPDPDRLFLVRPDGYLGLCAEAADWRAAEIYLETLAA